MWDRRIGLAIGHGTMYVRRLLHRGGGEVVESLTKAERLRGLGLTRGGGGPEIEQASYVHGLYVFSPGPVHARSSPRPVKQQCQHYRPFDRRIARTVDSIFNLQESLEPLGKRSARQESSLFGYFRLFPLQAMILLRLTAKKDKIVVLT